MFDIPHWAAVETLHTFAAPWPRLLWRGVETPQPAAHMLASVPRPHPHAFTGSAHVANCLTATVPRQPIGCGWVGHILWGHVAFHLHSALLSQPGATGAAASSCQMSNLGNRKWASNPPSHSPHFCAVPCKVGVESTVESSTLFHPQQQVCCGEFKQKCGKCASGVECQTLHTLRFQPCALCACSSHTTGLGGSHAAAPCAV